MIIYNNIYIVHIPLLISGLHIRVYPVAQDIVISYHYQMVSLDRRSTNYECLAIHAVM